MPCYFKFTILNGKSRMVGIDRMWNSKPYGFDRKYL